VASQLQRRERMAQLVDQNRAKQDRPIQQKMVQEGHPTSVPSKEATCSKNAQKIENKRYVYFNWDIFNSCNLKTSVEK